MILPQDGAVSIVVDGAAVAFKTLVLADNGQLVLADESSVRLGSLAANTSTEESAAAAGCRSGQVSFANWRPRSWFDPSHWTLVDETDAVVDSLAVPHSDRIPCAHDSVLISDQHGLSIDFNGVQSLTIGALKFGHQV